MSTLAMIAKQLEEMQAAANVNHLALTNKFAALEARVLAVESAKTTILVETAKPAGTQTGAAVGSGHGAAAGHIIKTGVGYLTFGTGWTAGYAVGFGKSLLVSMVADPIAVKA